MGVREVAAFLGHVGASTSCGRFYPNPMAWGLCYKREMSPYQNFYCDASKNYTAVSKESSTMAEALFLIRPIYPFLCCCQLRINKWMTPVKWRQPSAHDVFVGNWKQAWVAAWSSAWTKLEKMFAGSSLWHLMGVNHDYSGRSLDCADQVVFNPSSKSFGS
ncbi:hypothetical protein VPH35_054642 [Triticum aestivum]